MRGFFKGLLGLEQGARSLPISTPDITKMQVAAALKFVAVAATSFSLLSPPEAEALTGASGLLCTGLVISDSIIRKGRAQAIAAKILAGIHGTGTAGSRSPVAELIGLPLPPAPTLTQGGSQPREDPAGDGTGAALDPAAAAAVAADAAGASEEPAAATTGAEQPSPPEPAVVEAPVPPSVEEIQAARDAVANTQAILQALLARIPAQQ